jgi:hypothetical protein
MARRPAAGRNRGRSNRVAGRFDRDAALDRWTPEMMADRVERSYGEVRQVHSRTSILQRLLTNEAYHGGELAIAWAATTWIRPTSGARTTHSTPE